MKEQNKDNYITIRVTNEFKIYYKELCESMGITFSKRIHSLIKKDVEVLENLKKNI